MRGSREKLEPLFSAQCQTVFGDGVVPIPNLWAVEPRIRITLYLNQIETITSGRNKPPLAVTQTRTAKKPIS